MKLSLAKRYLLLALVLIVIAGMFWVDAGQRLFKARRTPSLDWTEDVASTEAQGSDAWSLLFERRVPPKEQFTVITEKNVFSPLRKAWAPPPPPEEEPEPEPEVEEEKLEETLPRRNDVELRGTAMIDQERKAILRFKSFRSGQTMLLAEGAVAQEKNVQDGPKYTVLNINSESVRLKDGAGQVFLVGLYDHGREATRQATPQASVEVAPASEAKPAVSSDESTSSAVVVGGAGATTNDSAEARMKRTQEQNERLVKEGKMKKIVTPFGPLYRKNE